MNNNNTQLISADSYDVNNMIFSEPIDGSIPDQKPAITFKRVMISSKNDDGSVGELVISTEELFTFGVSENKNKDTGKTNGYVLPLCLFNKNGATSAEERFVELFGEIVNKCKDYLIDNKEKLDRYELEMSDLKRLNPIYYKKEKGKIVDGAVPTLYGKLIHSKKNGIVTKFYDMDSGEQLDPMQLMGTFGTAKAVVKFESIFLGKDISLQVKIYEADIRPTSSGMKRLMKRPASDNTVRLETQRKSIPYKLEDKVDDDAGSIGVEVEDQTEDDSPPPKKEVKEEAKPKRKVKTVTKGAPKRKSEDDE